MDMMDLNLTGMTDPQLIEIFRTNLVPTEPESIAVKDTISNRQNALRRLEGEIQRVRAALERLEQEHSALQGQVDAYKAVISPVRRLPPELLADIFVLVTDPFSCPRSSSSSSPLLLCGICSAWRNIALEFPLLWTNINVSCSSTEKCITQLNEANICFGRAKSLPLSLNLDFKERIGAPSIDIEPKEIIRFFPSCWTVRLTLTWPLWTHILKHQSGHVGLLEHLVMTVPDFEFDTTDTLFMDAPRLRSVEFRFHGEPITNIQTLPLPFHQLVNLCLRSIHLRLIDIRELSRRCINLVTLSLIIRSAKVEHLDVDSNLRIVFPKLRSLHVVSCRDAGLPRLLQKLTLPALNEISLADQDIPHWPHQAYTDLQSRSSCDIHTFSASYSFTEKEMLEVLQTMPSLRTLHLTSPWRSTSSTLQLLTYDPAHPFLRHLTNVHIPLADGAMEILTQMIESRWWPDTDAGTSHQGVSRLESVGLTVFVDHGLAFFDEWTHKGLSGLVKDWTQKGLNMQVSSSLDVLSQYFMFSELN